MSSELLGIFFVTLGVAFTVSGGAYAVWSVVNEIARHGWKNDR